MARIVLGSYMVRYPLAGMLSSPLQWLFACDRLGHEVYLAEKSGSASSCFDPSRNVMTDDCSYGTKVVDALLSRFGLSGRWCYLAADGRYHGLSKESIEAALASADLFFDFGSHGTWRRRPDATRRLLDSPGGRLHIVGREETFPAGQMLAEPGDPGGRRGVHLRGRPRSGR